VSNYQVNRIHKPRSFVADRNRGRKQKYYIIGFDSEADTSTQGKPMLFQFCLPMSSEQDVILREVPEFKKHAGLWVFLDFIDEYCRDDRVAYLIYVWNLAYELTQLFHDLPAKVRSAEEYTISALSNGRRKYDWEIDVVNGKRQLITFRSNGNASHHVTVRVIDGKAFYNTSLNNAAKMLGLGEKFVMSEKLSRSTFTRADLHNEEFLMYARRDAYITQAIGNYIEIQHSFYDLDTTLSAPHFASTIFKKRFLKSDLRLGSASSDLEQAGLYSYHGGKNGFYLDGPAQFSNAYFYDITSAYPEAMRQLPDIEASGWKRVNKHRPGSHALYCISGDYRKCTYGGMQNHDGSWTETGYVSQIWVTGYELDQMVNRGEIKLDSVSGFEMIGPSGGALQEYVDEFFRLKRESTGPLRETAKLLLNSLYGKFFQKQPLGSVGAFDLENQVWIETDPTADWDYEAGGLYDPAIASLITGFVRARIHGLEHKYESVMTSTDGFFGLREPDQADLGSDLGQLKSVSGNLRLWRERLYIFDGNDGDRKYALHGFHGNVEELQEIPLAKGEYKYLGRQMITLKMSTTARGTKRYAPGTFTMLNFTLKL
jgi:hypothetical protein